MDFQTVDCAGGILTGESGGLDVGGRRSFKCGISLELVAIIGGMEHLAASNMTKRQGLDLA
jgi:hypothetical protein